METRLSAPPPSFPRKREPSGFDEPHWVPALAGTTEGGAAIDWSAPWLVPLRDLRPLAERGDWRAALSTVAAERGIAGGGGAPLVFVAPDNAGAVAYETHIHATGRVPTRDNGHDLFNALIWLAFPRTKAALNARQAAQIARAGIGNRRGPVRDAATLIDESALLVATDDAAVLDALHAHDWPALFARGRNRWGTAIRVVAFGHALIEKLTSPYKSITAAVVPLPACASLAAMDAAAARFAQRADLAPRLLPHLPVLGVPGWWADNERPEFYADTSVFRPRRAASSRNVP